MSISFRTARRQLPSIDGNFREGARFLQGASTSKNATTGILTNLQIKERELFFGLMFVLASLLLFCLAAFANLMKSKEIQLVYPILKLKSCPSCLEICIGIVGICALAIGIVMSLLLDDHVLSQIGIVVAACGFVVSVVSCCFDLKIKLKNISLHPGTGSYNYRIVSQDDIADVGNYLNTSTHTSRSEASHSQRPTQRMLDMQSQEGSRSCGIPGTSKIFDTAETSASVHTNPESPPSPQSRKQKKQLTRQRELDPALMRQKKWRKMIVISLLLLYVLACTVLPQVFRSSASCVHGFFWEEHLPFFFCFFLTKVVELLLYTFDKSIDGRLPFWKFALAFFPSFLGYFDGYQDALSVQIALACARERNDEMASTLHKTMNISFWVGVVGCQWLGLTIVALCMDDSFAVLTKLVHMDALAACINMDNKLIWLWRVVNLVRFIAEDLPQASQQAIFVILVQRSPFMILSVLVSVCFSLKSLYEAMARVAVAYGFIERLGEVFNEQELEQIFKDFDADESGTIDINELSRLLKHMDVNFSESCVEKMYHVLDADGSGAIDKDEFVWFFRGRHKIADLQTMFQEAVISEEEVLAAFREYDANGNGAIDEDELEKALQKLHIEANSEVITRLMFILDRGGSGQISQQEFLKFFIGLPKSEGVQGALTKLSTLAKQRAKKARETFHDLMLIYDPRDESCRKLAAHCSSCIRTRHTLPVFCSELIDGQLPNDFEKHLRLSLALLVILSEESYKSEGLQKAMKLAVEKDRPILSCFDASECQDVEPALEPARADLRRDNEIFPEDQHQWTIHSAIPFNRKLCYNFDKQLHEALEEAHCSLTVNKKLGSTLLAAKKRPSLLPFL